MSKDQESRARRFRELHAGGHFVIANCWDAGSARVLASLGFPALATSSSAAAAVLGRLDHGISIEESLANARLICGATDLPVSADLEKSFGDQPADTARAITRAAVLFAPALPDLAAVRAVCAAVNKPVNFMVAFPGKSFSVAELAAAGVRRVSLA